MALECPYENVCSAKGRMFGIYWCWLRNCDCEPSRKKDALSSKSDYIQPYMRKKKGGYRKCIPVEGYNRRVKSGVKEARVNEYKLCPRCEHYTLIKSGKVHLKEEGDRWVMYCTRCGYREIASVEETKDE